MNAFRKDNCLDYLSRLLLCLSVLVDLGCGTWLGNPLDPDEDTKSETQSTITLDFTSTLSSTALIANSIPVIGSDGQSSGTITLSAAKIALKEIELERADGSDSAEEQADFDFLGPYVVDFIADTVTPDPSSIKLSAGDYKQISLKMDLLDEEDAAAAGISDSDLIDRSVYLAGTYTTTAGATRSFRLSFELDEEFTMVDGNRVIKLGAGETSSVLIAFQISEWFDFSYAATNAGSLDFEDITAQNIDLDDDAEDENTLNLLDVIKENIQRSGDFVEDKDEDGEFEDEDKEEEDDESDEDDEESDEDEED